MRGERFVDCNPATLKPARESAVAAELASLAGGAVRLAERGRELAATDTRLACHLVELAALAAPDDPAVHAARAEVYESRRTDELSLMSKGIYGAAAQESRTFLEQSASN
jgi:alkyl sulfatase BDS1-like metallo-beta-lactamase superfamily hydrolase